MRSKTVCLAFAGGCPRAQSDLEDLAFYFKQNGWRVETSPENADMVIASGCGFTQRLEDYSCAMLSHIAKKKAGRAPMFVVGCLAGINPDRLRKELEATPLPARELKALDSKIQASTSYSSLCRPIHTAGFKEDPRSCLSWYERTVAQIKSHTAGEMLQRALHSSVRLVESIASKKYKYCCGR